MVSIFELSVLSNHCSGALVAGTQCKEDLTVDDSIILILVNLRGRTAEAVAPVVSARPVPTLAFVPATVRA